MAEFDNPGTSYDSRTVVQASEAGEGTNPYAVGAGAGVGAGLMGVAMTKGSENLINALGVKDIKVSPRRPIKVR